MAGLLLILVTVIALLIFDLLAVRFGADSREGFGR